MEETKENLLNEELIRMYKTLSATPAGTPEAEKLIKDIAVLENVAAEQRKLEIEAKEAEDKAENEDRKLRNEQTHQNLELIEAQKKRKTDFIMQSLGIGATLAGAVIGQLFTKHLLGTVLRFEQTGEYVTSSAGKSLIGSLFRKK